MDFHTYLRARSARARRYLWIYPDTSLSLTSQISKGISGYLYLGQVTRRIFVWRVYANPCSLVGSTGTGTGTGTGTAPHVGAASFSETLFDIARLTIVPCSAYSVCMLPE